MEKERGVTFRITKEYPDGFIPTMRTRYGMTLMVREIGVECGVHYHGYCKGVKMQTLRTYLKRSFTGNGEYSCKYAGDDGAALRYLCKGGQKEGEKPDIVFNEGHVIDALHGAYWDHNRVYKKRARKGDILDRCYEDIEDAIGFSTDRRVIGSEIIGWYDEMGKRMPARFAMDTMITTYIVRQNKKQSVPLTKLELYDQLYGC